MPELVNQQGDAAYDPEAFDVGAFQTGTVWRRLEPDPPAQVFDPAAFDAAAFATGNWQRQPDPTSGSGYGGPGFGVGGFGGGAQWVRQDPTGASWTRV